MHFYNSQLARPPTGPMQLFYFNGARSQPWTMHIYNLRCINKYTQVLDVHAVTCDALIIQVFLIDRSVERIKLTCPNLRCISKYTQVLEMHTLSCDALIIQVLLIDRSATWADQVDLSKLEMYQQYTQVLDVHAVTCDALIIQVLLIDRSATWADQVDQSKLEMYQ